MEMITGEIVPVEKRYKGERLFSLIFDDKPVEGEIYGLIIDGDRKLIIAKLDKNAADLTFKIHNMQGGYVATFKTRIISNRCTGFWLESRNIGMIMGNISRSDTVLPFRNLMKVLEAHKETFKQIKLF